MWEVCVNILIFFFLFGKEKSIVFNLKFDPRIQSSKIKITNFKSTNSQQIPLSYKNTNQSKYYMYHILPVYLNILLKKIIDMTKYNKLNDGKTKSFSLLYDI